MLFLGIDPSLNGTGLCLTSSDGVITHLETVRPGSRRGAERLAYVKASVEALLTSKIKFVGIEGYAYDCVGRVFELGEIGGVLRLLLYEKQCTYIEVAPASLKKFAVNCAAARKETMVHATMAEGISVSDDNQADAFFLAMIARYFYMDVTASTRARLEVIHRLKHPPKKKPVRHLRTLLKDAL
jgi:Holliday junction resolvasome RuvABC endonuclease subunit